MHTHLADFFQTMAPAPSSAIPPRTDGTSPGPDGSAPRCPLLEPLGSSDTVCPAAWLLSLGLRLA